MNLHELIDDLYHACVRAHIMAGSDAEWPYLPVRAMLDAYEALEPDWSQAPSNANWYAIEANGSAAWYQLEPTLAVLVPGWCSLSYLDFVGNVRIPLGIDWRLCKWQRPEVQR